MSKLEPLPLSLYIHMPWCIKKCPYCDFNSHSLTNDLPELAYIDALLDDLKCELPYIWGRPIQTIFIGGGTPSLFSAKALQHLLQTIRSLCPLSPNIEITLEANPGTLEQTNFAGYLAAGINRLSIGVQSFNPDHLTALGRIHQAQEAIRAIERAKSAGFVDLNCDLMYGLPNQSKAQALQDLKTAMALAPTHISWYQLTIEPNTLFAHHPPQLPADEQVADMADAGERLLAKANYNRYEISAYCQDHQYCKHNINYWEFGDYLGIGAGAHSKLSDLSTQQIYRLIKHKNPKQYLQARSTSATPTYNPYLASKTKIDTDAYAFEFMLNACRLYRPISFALFESRTGLARTSIVKTLQAAKEKGLLQMNDDSFCLTSLGKRFYNDVVAMFLSSNS